MIHNLRCLKLIKSHFPAALKRTLDPLLCQFNYQLFSHFLTPSTPQLIQRTKMGKKRKSDAGSTEEAAFKEKAPKYSKKYEHAPIYLQILKLGSDTGESVPSLLLVFNKHKILFNTGPGILRYIAEKKIKINKLNNICFTRLSTEAISGLPSVFLTQNQMNSMMNKKVEEKETQSRIDINAPLKLENYVTNLSENFRERDLKFKLNNFGKKSKEGQVLDPIIKDEQVKISPIFIMPNAHPNISQFNFMEDKIKPVAIYICEFSEVKGKFKPERAEELKVRKGPDYGKLKDGEAVLNTDGEMVYPSQVLEASTPGTICIIVDCPDMTYMHSLVSAEGLRKWHGGEITQDTVVFHLSPIDIVESQVYLEWIEKFNEKVKHIFVDKQSTNDTFILRKAISLQYKLNMIDKHIFPLPKLPKQLKDKNEDVIMSDMSKYVFKPVSKRGIDNSEINEHFNPETVINEVKEENEDFISSIENYKKLKEELILKDTYPLYEDDIERSKIIERIDQNDIAITFLGTGAAVPNTYRNVSGIYIDFFARGSMIVDCGDGTYGQLLRKFGTEGTRDALRKLKCIWISHRHEDHHLGLAQILTEHYKAISLTLDVKFRQEPVLVIGTALILHKIESQLYLENTHYKFLLTRDTFSMKNWANTNKTLIQQGALGLYCNVKVQLDLLTLTSFSVYHCAQSFGLVLEGMKGWKVVFSGDTRPCDNLINYGQKATLLIHEATFEDELIDEAKGKKHSTVSEAIEMSKKCDAYRTILTHFSQRYPTIPKANYEENDNIVIAFDFMTVNLASLPYLPLVMDPCIKLLRNEDFVDDINDYDPALLVKYVT